MSSLQQGKISQGSATKYTESAQKTKPSASKQSYLIPQEIEHSRSPALKTPIQKQSYQPAYEIEKSNSPDPTKKSKTPTSTKKVYLPAYDVDIQRSPDITKRSVTSKQQQQQQGTPNTISRQIDQMEEEYPQQQQQKRTPNKQQVTSSPNIQRQQQQQVIQQQQVEGGGSRGDQEEQGESNDEQKKIKVMKNYTVGEDLALLEFVQECKEKGITGNIFKSEELKQRIPFRTVESMRDRYKRYLSYLNEQDIENLRQLSAEKGPDAFVHFVKSSDDITKKEMKFVSDSHPAGPRYRTIKEKQIIEGTDLPQQQQQQQQQQHIQQQKIPQKNEQPKKQTRKPKQKVIQNQQFYEEIEHVQGQDQYFGGFSDYRESFGSLRGQQQQQQQYRESFGRQQEIQLGKRKDYEGSNQFYDLQEVQKVLKGQRPSLPTNSLETILDGIRDYQIGSGQQLDTRFKEFDDYDETEEYIRFQKQDISLKVTFDSKTHRKHVSLFSKHLPQLKDRLESLAVKYGKELREIVADLEAVSGDLQTLVRCYENPELQGQKWLQMEDTILKDKDSTDVMFQMLIHNKGIENVKRRLKFLRINKNINY